MTARRLPGHDGRFNNAHPCVNDRKGLYGNKKRCHDNKKAAEPRKNWLDSFTKIAVMVILINAIAWVWCSYGLAYLERYAIAESLSQTAVNAILGTFIAYAVKSAVENVNKNGVNLKPTTKATAAKPTTIADAIIIGVNANLEE